MNGETVSQWSIFQAPKASEDPGEVFIAFLKASQRDEGEIGIRLIFCIRGGQGRPLFQMRYTRQTTGAFYEPPH
jgi:hypothetical protein